MIGLGAIGRRFARMAAAMDMRVIGYDPFAQELPEYVERVELQALFAQADASRCTAR